MLAVLTNLALIASACATGLALAYLVQREALVHRLAGLATMAGGAVHSVALIVLVTATGRPPFGTLSEAVSVAVLVVVLLQRLVERQYGNPALGTSRSPVA